jgi:membrane protease YdiL (CAAX protease family)
VSSSGRFQVGGAVVFYVALLGMALGWSALRGDVNVFVLPAETLGGNLDLPWRVALGIGVGSLAVLGSRLISRFRWARRLNAEFRRLLGPLSLGQVTLLATCSAVAEEAFFRGAMQPELGLVPTSFIFGLLHLGPGRAFWPWTLSALAAGFALGAVTHYSGDLLAATLAHFTVNYFNLGRIALGDPASD